MRIFVLILLCAACGDDDGTGGGNADAPAGTPDSAPGTPDAPAADARARSITFDLSMPTLTIEGTQVPALQLTNIVMTGTAPGDHYHVYLDNTAGQYLLFDEDVPTSPDFFIPDDTPAGSHVIIGAIEDAAHDPVGVQSERPLEVLVVAP